MQKLHSDDNQENNLAISGAAALGQPLETRQALAHIMADAPAAHTVAQKEAGGKMRSVRSVSKADLETAISVCDAEETFLSVNAFIVSRNPETYGHMKEKYVSRLVACYSDIDSYKKGIDVFDAFADIARLAFNGRLPQPSIIALSGRGLYLRWLLCDAKQGQQPQLIGLPYFPPADEMKGGAMQRNDRHEWKKVLYAQVQNAIYQRLAHLGADHNARDMTRVLRAPNSIHATATRTQGETVRVQYYAGVDPLTGTPWRYTLPELARSFGVPLTEDDKPLGFGRQTQARGSCEARRAGLIKLGHSRFTDYETMERTIGTPTQGKRWRCLLFLANSLRIAGFSDIEARRCVASASDRCQPPYPSSASDTTIQAIVKDAYSKRLKYSNKTLCELFGVTSENCEPLLTIRPPQEKPEPTYCRRTAAAHRRAFIGIFFAQNPNASLREICAAANEEGHGCAPNTVRSDLIKLNVCHRREPQAEPTLFEIAA